MAVLPEIVAGFSSVDAQPTGEVRQFAPPQLQIISHFDGRVVIQESSGDNRQIIIGYGRTLIGLYNESDNVFIVLDDLLATRVYHHGQAVEDYPKILGELREREVLLPDGTRRIKRYLAGGHPHLGKVVKGWQGTETLQEIHFTSV